WIETREHHRLDAFESGERRNSLSRGFGHRVADLDIADGLDLSGEESYFARAQLVDNGRLRSEHSERVNLVFFFRVHQADSHARPNHAVDHAHQHDHSAVTVKPRIEDQRFERRRWVSRWRRDLANYCLEHLIDARAHLG